MSRHEIRLSGFGGQGIMTAGYILGKAAALYDHLNVTLTKSYGPESRGGASCSQLIISDQDINYPHLTEPELLMTMSQEAYTKYIGNLASGGCCSSMKTWLNWNIPVMTSPYGPSPRRVSPRASWDVKSWPTL